MNIPIRPSGATSASRTRPGDEDMSGAVLAAGRRQDHHRASARTSGRGAGRATTGPDNEDEQGLDGNRDPTLDPTLKPGPGIANPGATDLCPAPAHGVATATSGAHLQPPPRTAVLGGRTLALETSAAPRPSTAGHPAQPVQKIVLRQPDKPASITPLHPVTTLPPARPPAIKRTPKRHRGVPASFVFLVAMPVIAAACYLWLVAQDQFASSVGFSIRKEEIQTPLDLMGGIGRLSGSSSSDTDILYRFVRSQHLVSLVDTRLDLRKIYGAAWPGDPLFALNPSGSIEDLQRYWDRVVKVHYDGSSGLLTLRVLAFDPGAAKAVAEAIVEESGIMINALSAIARADTTRHAEHELDRALIRLTGARQAMTQFRLRTRIVDPLADIQGQMGLLNTLQAQLAESMIDLDMLREATTRTDDPRIVQGNRRIEVITNRIADQRQMFGLGGNGPGGEDYASLMAEFERLSVEREFAEETYRRALSDYDAARADAQRQTRYLAAHISPTLAERSIYPQRWLILLLTGFFVLVGWSIGVLVYYSVRDRR